MELPELTILGNQMRKEIVGKTVSDVEVANPKCLNVPFEQFSRAVIGKEFKSVESKGKWLFIEQDSYMLLFNTGMGADVIVAIFIFEYYPSNQRKYQAGFLTGDHILPER